MDTTLISSTLIANALQENRISTGGWTLIVIIILLMFLLAWWVIHSTQRESPPDYVLSQEKLDTLASGSEPAVRTAGAVLPPEPPAPVTTPEPVAPVAPPVPLTPDDLTIVEGIGPKIGRILNDAGVLTFRQLAGMTPDQIKEIIQAGGIRLADPRTWSEQARLAAAGDLEGLKAYQARLTAGRGTST